MKNNGTNPARKLSVVLFDLDGTLRFNVPDVNEVIFEFAAGIGAEDSLENRRRAINWQSFYWAHSAELHQDMKTYPDFSDAFWENYTHKLLDQFGCSTAQVAEISPLLQAHLEHYDPENFIAPETPGLLASLRDHGYTLGLVTNRVHPLDETLEELGLAECFTVTVTAGETGVWKPDPQIFAYALAKLGVTPEQAVYVGDSYFADVVGAQAAGVQPILLDPHNMYPQATCPVIRSLRELPGILQKTL